MKRRLSPALVLFFLSPAIGELLSSSSPPAEFFNPAIFLLLAVLYGGGAIIVRELVFRWRKGWPSVLALGAAYGILEEGVAVKSFFDPSWPDLDELAWYGRSLGVNWVWAIHLTLFHMLFSIGAPILLVNLMFPARRSEPWVGRRKLAAMAALLMVEVLLTYFFLNPYSPPLAPYVLCVLSIPALVLLARRLPPDSGSRSGTPPRRAGLLTLLGFGATLLWFLTTWVAVQWGVPPPLTFFLLPALVGGAGWLATRLAKSSPSAWPERLRLGLVSGGLGVFILLTPLIELDQANRPDNVAGMTLVGLGFLVFLALMHRALRRAEGGGEQKRALM